MPRPASVLVFGILNLVFGGLGVLCTPFSLIGMATPDDGSNPVVTLMKGSPLYTGYLFVSVGLGVLLGVVLLAAGVGLVQSKAWGRTLSIVYGWVAIIAGIVGLGVTIFALLLPLLEQARQSSSAEDTAAAIGGVVGGLFGSLISFVYPVLLLIFMNRRALKDYLGGVAPATDPHDQTGTEPWQPQA